MSTAFIKQADVRYAPGADVRGRLRSDIWQFALSVRDPETGPEPVLVTRLNSFLGPVSKLVFRQLRQNVSPDFLQAGKGRLTFRRKV